MDKPKERIARNDQGVLQRNNKTLDEHIRKNIEQEQIKAIQEELNSTEKIEDLDLTPDEFRSNIEDRETKYQQSKNNNFFYDYPKKTKSIPLPTSKPPTNQNPKQSKSLRTYAKTILNENILNENINTISDFNKFLTENENKTTVLFFWKTSLDKLTTTKLAKSLFSKQLINLPFAVGVVGDSDILQQEEINLFPTIKIFYDGGKFVKELHTFPTVERLLEHIQQLDESVVKQDNDFITFFNNTDELSIPKSDSTVLTHYVSADDVVLELENNLGAGRCSTFSQKYKRTYG